VCRLCCGFAKDALKDGGKLVTFSPCIEQIQVTPLLLPVRHAPPCPHRGADMQRTAVQMRSAGFRDVRMFEILSRNMDCAPCEATAAILDEEACVSTPKQQNHPIKRLREAAQVSSGAGAVSIVSRPPKEEPGHTGYLLFGTLCLPALPQHK
jgi:hypothetical protein